jgi:hypothetical protein
MILNQQLHFFLESHTQGFTSLGGMITDRKEALASRGSLHFSF